MKHGWIITRNVKNNMTMRQFGPAETLFRPEDVANQGMPFRLLNASFETCYEGMFLGESGERLAPLVEFILSDNSISTIQYRQESGDWS